MRRSISVAILVFVVILGGCKKEHPSEIIVDPGFEPNEVGAILVAPVISSIPEGEDPQKNSERIIKRLLWNNLSRRGDYDFIASNQFIGVVNQLRINDRYDKFTSLWIEEHTADREFLGTMAGEIKADLLMLTHVHQWYKDEADYREEGASSATQVGVTISLVDMKSGHILWEATDQNYEEAVRTEGDRQSAMTGGLTRRVSGVTATGRDMYAAPPFEGVAAKVVNALVGALPERGVAQ